MKVSVIEIERSPFVKPLVLPNIYRTGVSCGFPSPADDYTESTLDIGEHLVKHPSSTYFAKAEGSSMEGVGIYDGDLLVVDRSVTPVDSHIVVVAIAGELTCKMLDLRHNCLRSANPAYKPIPITEGLETVIEGVVTHAVHYLNKV